MKELQGIAVSPGVALGRVFLLDDARRRMPRRTIAPAQVPAEQERLRTALLASVAELKDLQTRAETEFGSDAAGIFGFHSGLLRDKSITDPMLKRVETECVSAEWAVQEQFRIVAEMFARMSDSAFQSKVDDVWDLDHRVLRHLVGRHAVELSTLEHPAIVVAPDLTPSRASQFDRSRVLGFATDSGGSTSHTAIFARALGIPAVVGLGHLSEAASEGDLAILDGERGVVILDPDEPTIERYRRLQQAEREVALSLAEVARLPAITTDGTKIEILANIEFGSESRTAIEAGADGVGLFRTEFLWLTRDHEPTEEEQFEEYKLAIQGANGKAVTLRTFDLGADKYTQERAELPERNPFLGLRSIRYCFENPEMFRIQLRAILRASAFGPTKVMFPLISTILELRRARMMVLDVMEELTEDGIPFDRNVEVGMMIEVPAAALTAPSLAREAAFFSIGTNDLIQYTMAADRTNERVADLYTPGHPAVLRLIKEVLRAGRRQGIGVSVCGEMAGQVDYALLLIGLGLRTLSVTPSSIGRVKRAIRSVDKETCERLARTAGSFDSERQVTAYLREKARRLFPELIDGRAVGGSPG